MSDEVPSGRLSQIFDSLTNLQQQQQQQLQQQHQQQQPQKSQQPKQQRPRSTSSTPSPVGSGRATPSGGTHVHVQQHLSSFQQHSHNFYLRHASDSYFVPSGTQTFPSATSQAHHHHLLPAHYYQQHHQQQQQNFLYQQQQQQSSLPPLLYDSQSLNTSPLLSKRATSFSGNIPLVRGETYGSANAASQIRCSHVAAAAAALTSQSTPNSPRLMPRRTQRAPPIPAKPNAAQLAATATSTAAAASTSQSTQSPALAALDADAPWPHFSALTEHLDVHQLNNYSHAVPEINWQERCLELQLELHRSKNQAGRIRDMLRDKVRIR